MNVWYVFGKRSRELSESRMKVVTDTEVVVIDVRCNDRVQFLQMSDKWTAKYVVRPVFVHSPDASVTQMPVMGYSRSRPRRSLMFAVSSTKPQ